MKIKREQIELSKKNTKTNPNSAFFPIFRFCFSQKAVNRHRFEARHSHLTSLKRAIKFWTKENGFVFIASLVNDKRRLQKQKRQTKADSFRWQTFWLAILVVNYIRRFVFICHTIHSAFICFVNFGTHIHLKRLKASESPKTISQK